GSVGITIGVRACDSNQRSKSVGWCASAAASAAVGSPATLGKKATAEAAAARNKSVRHSANGLAARARASRTARRDSPANGAFAEIPDIRKTPITARYVNAQKMQIAWTTNIDAYARNNTTETVGIEIKNRYVLVPDSSTP